MKKITLLLGGARSGKSHYAQELAKFSGQKVLFVATAEAGDRDMQLRIEKHRQGRPADWRILEATSHIGSRIKDEIEEDESLVIIDCITLLVSNIFCHYSEKEFETIEESLLEKQVVSEINELREYLQKADSSFIIVSNEVGLAIVPENRMSRIYRDLLGRANQMLAQSSDEVYFMVAGIPLRVKPERR